MPRSIAVTFDYRCPFARNAHEAVLGAIRAGRLADVEWRFVAFSLDQAHTEDGDVPVWERDPGERGTGVLALEYGIAARDTQPGAFLAVHDELFRARHDHGKKLHELATVHDAVRAAGADLDALTSEVETGRPLKTLAAEHTEMVDGFDVFGVPTFVEGNEATFIRFMERGNVDDLERALGLLDWSRLNEFKRTRLPK